MSITAEEIITNLDLQPHPEGGWYRETFNNRADGEIRGTMTAIYFLLKKGETSHWHRVLDADEVWSWIAGGSLTFSHIAPASETDTGTAARPVLELRRRAARGRRPARGADRQGRPRAGGASGR